MAENDFRALRATDRWRDIQHELEGLSVPTPALAAVEQEVNRIHLQVAKRYDRDAPWTPQNRSRVDGLIVLGPSGSSKSYAIETAFAKLVALELPDGRLLQPNPVLLDAPAYGTTTALSRTLISELLGAEMAREPSRQEASRKVVSALVKSKPTIVGVDWISRILNPDRHSAKSLRSEAQLFWEQMMAAMSEPRWPTPVVLAGLPIVTSTLGAEDLPEDQRKARREALARFSVLRLPDVRLEEADFFVEVIQRYCRSLGMHVVNSLFQGDVPQRLIHATGYAVGHALVLCQEACALAKVRPDSRGLKISDFADTYAAWTGCSADSNPFVSPHWPNIDTGRIAPRCYEEARFRQSPTDGA